MVTLADIQAAERRISGKVIRTPLVYSPTLSRMTGAKIYLKLETLQKAGSFKVRGATNKIMIHHSEILASGVIAASAGNHAQGVAVAASGLGMPATVVMPEWASLPKQEATRGYGASVIIQGASLEESIARAEEMAKNGALFIHPFNDEEIIAGQGTIGLEILEDLPGTDMIVVPVGGGGLIAGIALAAKSLRREIRIIGVQTTECPSAKNALEHKTPECVPARKTIADGIRVEGLGSLPMHVIQDWVDQVTLAKEEEIADAMLLLLERKHIIAEGAGAVPVAAILNGSIAIVPGSTIVLVISGGNVEINKLFRIIRSSLIRSGRLIDVAIDLDDIPGALPRLLDTINGGGGKIVGIRHPPGEKGVPVFMERIVLEIETRGQSHATDILRAIAKAGYLPEP
ncbi:MAG TPA: threonine ammonia-lyase [Methanoregula sp.]|nr:threonine ammonia-lyase [Methanoregula sp.]